MSSSNTTFPAPWSWTPADSWDGNDGSWNTFTVQVGTPPQTFRVLPSTNGQETWVLNPAGCTQNDSSDCPYLRGASSGSTGFQSNESSTWDGQGLYELDEQETALGYYGNGLYGFDTVSLNSTKILTLKRQVVASIADKSYYLGVFGVGPKPINFTTFNDPIPNFLANLVNTSRIPSLSFGYTAGAAYRNKAPASLTFGGYDDGRIKASSGNMSFQMNSDNSRPLQVGVTKVIGDNTLSGTSNLLPTGTFHLIDSTIPHIWLPSDAINAFVAAFGLQHDNTTDLYLINDTMRNRHLKDKPTVTFYLSVDKSDGSSLQAIALPYAAFDLQASSPFYSTPTNYFPIRLAHNTTQYTLGRTFLQEAYLTADWERQSFSVAQASFDNLDSPSLVPILSIADSTKLSQDASSTPNSDGQAHNLGPGGIAGIVIGVVAAIALITLAVIWVMLRKRKQRRHRIAAQSAQYNNEKRALSREGNGLSEMAAYAEQRPYAEVDATAAKWGSTGVQEVDSHPFGHEVEGKPVRYELDNAQHGTVHETYGTQRTRHELPGTDARRPEES